MNGGWWELGEGRNELLFNGDRASVMQDQKVLEIHSAMWIVNNTVQFSSVQPLSRVWLFETPWIAACQGSLSITNSQSPPKLMSIESVMPFSHLILCHPLLLLPPIARSQCEELRPWQRSWGRRLGIRKGGIKPQESPWKFSSNLPPKPESAYFLLCAFT